FRLRVRFLSLFSRRLVIKEVALISPNIVWLQDVEGKWKLPSSRSTQTAASTVSKPEVESESTQSSPTQAAPVVAVTPPANRPSPPPVTILDQPSKQQLRLAMPPEVQRVSIRNGNFSFLDHDGRPLAVFSGVNFGTSIRSALALHGNAKVARISLQNRFFLEQLRSPLRYELDSLELSNISARPPNGEINGYFAMQTEAEDSPFTTSVKFRDVLADQIISNAGGPKGMVQGKLEGSFQASGKTADPEALMGQGEISLRDGRVQQYSLLVLLGELLQIEYLKHLHLHHA